MSTKINIAQICTATLMVDYVNKTYSYVSEKTTGVLKKTTRPAGFVSLYDLFNEEILTKEDIEKNKCYIVKDNKVYWKPHIEFTMSDGNKICKFFETERDADDYIRNNSELRKINWIEK